jgi:CspA family cold shock protein
VAEGRVKWFSSEKGYGFIEMKDKDVFVHFSALQMEGYKSMEKGDLVQFDIVNSDKGEQAQKVKILEKAAPKEKKGGEKGKK